MSTIFLFLGFSVTGAAAAALYLRKFAPKKTLEAVMSSAAVDCKYVDPVSGDTFPLDVPRWSGGERDGQPISLMLSALPGITRAAIDVTKRSLWRYSAAFPMQCAEPISLGEGCTRLDARRVS